MSAEIFPLSMRGIGTGICMLSAWFTACAVSQLFPVSLFNIIKNNFPEFSYK